MGLCAGGRDRLAERGARSEGAAGVVPALERICQETEQAIKDGFVVRDMRVEGLQRIAEGTVFNYLPINVGDTVDQTRIGEAIRALYGQSLFDDIEFRRDGDTLIIAVHERPSIESLLSSGAYQDHDELMHEAVRANIRASANQLRHGSQLLEDLIQNEGLLVVGAEYSLETGVVDFFDGLP